MEKLLELGFGLHPKAVKRLGIGAGSRTYDVFADEGRFILKNPSASEINNPELEPELCAHLLKRGLRVSEFVKTLGGAYIFISDGEIYHLQKFVDGVCYEWHKAPDWLMPRMANALGRIHAALETYPELPEGIGKGFFEHMTPENALGMYKNTQKRALELGDGRAARELEERVEIVSRMKTRIDCSELTRKNTHGDYFISQLLCGDDRINAVIDWTSACVHPAVWELMRSYVYAAPECEGGSIDVKNLMSYIDAYLAEAPLTARDIELMPTVYFYQIAVCDYYNQYYASTADNRGIYLEQARFATNMMRYFDKNLKNLTEELMERYAGVL